MCKSLSFCALFPLTGAVRICFLAYLLLCTVAGRKPRLDLIEVETEGPYASFVSDSSVDCDVQAFRPRLISIQNLPLRAVAHHHPFDAFAQRE